MAAATTRRDIDVQANADVQVVTRSTARQTRQSDTEIDCDETVTSAVRDAAKSTDSNQREIDPVKQEVKQMARIDISPVSQTIGWSPPQSEFQAAQRNDPALINLWARAEAGHADVRIIDDLLYKAAPPHLLTMHEYLLVLPASYAKEVIRMAHDEAGHMGVRKTHDRIRAIYYFPKMQKQVRRHVRYCKQCQMIAPKRTSERQPLQPVDVMHTHPFLDISIDIMGGSLPRTSRGNQYLMVIVCNVSKWTHAIPLRNLRADTIAAVSYTHLTLPTKRIV